MVDLKALTTALIERYRLARSAGQTHNGKRDLYEVLGYADVITHEMYRARHRRGGIAKRIVEAYPKATWRGGAFLVEDESPKVTTAFEEAFESLNERLKVWPTLKRADILAGLGSFSVILLGADGNLSDELPKGNGTPDSLLYLTPFAGGVAQPKTSATASLTSGADVTVAEFETDPTSVRFGLPKTYQLKRTSFASADLQKPVHWTRIIHIAENLLDDEVYGTPTLEDVWNLLDDLDKVTGGGAEAFWMRANAGVHFNLDKDMPGLTEPEKEQLRQQAEEYTHGISRVIRSRGMEINQLGSDVANFSNPADSILTQIAGTKGIPKRLLLGSEMGQLASGQDADNWNTQVQDRRTDYAGPSVVRPLIDRLVEYNYLPAPKHYEVEWPTIDNLTETEKAEGAAKWASVNATQGEIVFTSAEIRDKWYGMEPLPAPAAPPPPDPNAPPPPPDPNEPPVDPEVKAAEDLESTMALAILTNDTETIDRIIGIRHEQ